MSEKRDGFLVYEVSRINGEVRERYRYGETAMFYIDDAGVRCAKSTSWYDTFRTKRDALKHALYIHHQAANTAESAIKSAECALERAFKKARQVEEELLELCGQAPPSGEVTGTDQSSVLRYDRPTGDAS